MPKLPEVPSHEPPEYAEVPLPQTPEELGFEERARQIEECEAAEEAFRETVKTNYELGIAMPTEFRERYEKLLGKTRVAELIEEFHEPELFEAN